MTETKLKPAFIAFALAGIAVGAGGQKLAGPALNIAAAPTELRISRDGFGLSVVAKIGAGGVHRVLNWDRKGETPLLDGQPFSDDHARALGLAAAAFVKVAEEQTGAMAEALATSKPSTQDR